MPEIYGSDAYSPKEIARKVEEVGVAKADLSLRDAFFRGVLGNLFVCLAVWICLAGRSVADKVLAMLLPLSALAALQLEHILASLYYLPRGWLLLQLYPDWVTEEAQRILTLPAIGIHFVMVTLGNIVGGSLMVGLVYYIIYRRHPDPDE